MSFSIYETLSDMERWWMERDFFQFDRMRFIEFSSLRNERSVFKTAFRPLKIFLRTRKRFLSMVSQQWGDYLADWYSSAESKSRFVNITDFDANWSFACRFGAEIFLECLESIFLFIILGSYKLTTLSLNENPKASAESVGF